MMSELDPAVMIEDLLSDPSGETPEIPAWTIQHVTKRIAAINAIKMKARRLAIYKQDMMEYYADRIAATETAIERLEGDIKAYMLYHGETSIPTVQGTAYLAKRTKPIWNEVKAWEFVNSQADEDRKRFVRTKEELNKETLKEAAKTVTAEQEYLIYEVTEGVVLKKRGDMNG